MPLSSSPRIDRDEIIELLEESLHRLPQEMRQARWMIKERQEFVAKTRREADELLEAARVQAERMVQRTEVVRAAEARARQINEAAETDARRLRHETEDFLDQRLGSFEVLLDRVTKTVHAGRTKLAIGAHRTAEEGLEVDDDPTKGFFDQDNSHSHRRS
jgi:cell division septum initiation protein DivIVA